MFKSSYSNLQPYIEKFFLQNYGWNLVLDNKHSDAKIEKVCKQMGFNELSECLSSFAINGYPEALPQIVAKEFSICESYFFRDKKFFHALKHKIIPQFIKEKTPNDKNINIWSVGCSSGEEAYSVSIMLHENIPDIKSWNIQIVGTDVNIDVLEKAKKGVYSEYSFRDTPDSYKKSYFKNSGDKYEVLELYKKNVHFMEHNIVHKTNPLSPRNTLFDLIILKNVLIYFNPQKGKEVVDYLYENLKPNGWLSTTPVEYSSTMFSSYRATNFSSEGLIQKSLTNKMPTEISYQVDDDFEAIQLLESEQLTLQEKTVFEETPYTHYKKSCEMLEAGEMQEAKKYLRKSLYLNDKFIVSLISLGNVYKKEDDMKNYTTYINRAKDLLFKMEPEEIVEFSGNMSVNELIEMINHEKIEDKGSLNANI